MSDEPKIPDWHPHLVGVTEILELVIPEAEYLAVYEYLTGPAGYSLLNAYTLEGARARLTVRRQTDGDEAMGRMRKTYVR